MAASYSVKKKKKYSTKVLGKREEIINGIMSVVYCVVCVLCVCVCVCIY